MAGRCRKDLDSPQELKIIRDLAAKGCNDATIARALQASPTHFCDRKRESAEIRDALNEGRAVEHDQLFGVLHEAAVVKKNIVAAMFLMKTRHGYREMGDMPASLQVNVGVKFELQLPKPVSEQDWQTRIANGLTIDGTVTQDTDSEAASTADGKRRIKRVRLSR